jgi:hypothetical protein
MSISAEWYVLVTSAGAAHEFATMGPYPTKADAVNAADVARVPHYRVKRSGAKSILVRR